MKKLMFLLFIWFSTGSHSDLFSQIIDAEKTCTSTACHGNIVTGTMVHSPVTEDCEYCHASTGEEHPQNKVKGFSLTEKTPMLCYMCHDAKNSKKNVHYPVQDGDCMSCHVPHSSANASLLRAESPSKLCSECHDLEMEQYKVKHMAVSEGECTDCHNSHQSDFSSLLTEQAPNLCFQCHENAGENTAHVHAPYTEECLSCHTAHGSNEEHLATQKTPDLCYMCHEAKNNKNHVHYPVQDGDCMSCHAPHSSANASLLTAESPSKLCSECHDLEMEQHKVKHLAVSEGECTDCHQSHQSDFSSLLTEQAPNLCFQCHENVSENVAHVHAPYTEECLSCHTAHSSNENHLTSQQTPGLCYVCHDDIREDVETAALAHKAVHENKNCANCHSPHASSEYKLLIAQEKELCLNCHNKVLQNSKFVHAAIENGCVVCHKPHASSESSLLVEAFPHENYTAASLDNFALCFSCHDSELLDQPQTTTATNFRDGSKNLHHLHINGEKGRNCNMCHNMHGSDNEHMIAKEVQFGNWEMPMNYNVQENGGSCSTGCHGEQKYVR